MSTPRQKHVWICLAGDRLSSAFTTAEMAEEWCKMQNEAAGHTQDKMLQLGFKSYGREHHSFVRLELRRGID